MKILVVGLGSMGKRRIRNLFANNQNDICGIDVRADRREEAASKYQIPTYESIEEATQLHSFDALVISVPPDKHMHYVDFALHHEMHCFIEASVVDEQMQDVLQQNRDHRVKICPSCTLRFHPAIKAIHKLIQEEKIGKISNFSYHSGQYLPDWHPWESITEFYVSNPATGGGREIVPFELTWLNWVFGDIAAVKGFYNKTIALPAAIDDTYVAAIQYQSGVLGTLVVDVVSRCAVRRLVINGEKGQITWDWNDKYIVWYDAQSARSIQIGNPAGKAAEGYHANIVEEMYIEEIEAFLQAISGKGDFPNSLEEDYKLLQYLYELERSDVK